MQVAPATPQAVRDTLDAVFRTAPYQPTRAESLWDRVRAWWALLRAGTERALEVPAVQWTVLAVVGALLVYAAVRVLARAELDTGTHGRRARTGRTAATDAWADAESAAAEGRLHEAAHLTYGAVLDAMARRDLLRRHPSRTLGDYRRELRARGAPVHADFRAFAARYEPFVYGGARADRASFDALRASARPLVFDEPARR